MKRSTIILEFAALVAFAACPGCTESFECRDAPTEPMCQAYLDGARFVDGGPADTGDAGSDAHTPCNGACTGATSACLVSGGTETCVGCLGNGDCSGATSRCETTSHACVACLGDGDCSGTTHRCETTSHACVACLASADCTSPTAAACNTTTHACGACTTNADCTHLSGVGVCDSGTCVACTVADETACGANSCNPATHTCTTTPRTSVATCHACAADSECSGANDRCVPMQFMGASHGNYCLRQLSAGCARPYSVPTSSRATTSGDAPTTYCGVDETLTTCEAVQALVLDTPCAMASECGAPSLADGLCATVNGTANRCTYSCGLSSQCPSGAACGAGGNYCGSP